jgi:succinate dehydrogenase / fumarate reductase membrane anchor subunit
MQQKAYRSATGRLERSSNFELFAWFFMRVSGMILLFIALFHLYYMHFIVDVAEIDFIVIAERWHGPYGILWRTFDIALLFFAFTHGTNGVRYIVEDYIHADGMRVALKTGLMIVYVGLLLMGTYVIFAFDSVQYLENKESLSALFQLMF